MIESGEVKRWSKSAATGGDENKEKFPLELKDCGKGRGKFPNYAVEVYSTLRGCL